jgi:hypothetical protein
MGPRFGTAAESMGVWMGVLAMLELQGETSELMAAAEEIDRRLPACDGLLARITAPTEDGMVLFQLWDSAESRQRNADDPEHAEVLAESGMLAAMRGTRSRVFDGAVLRRAVATEPR